METKHTVFLDDASTMNSIEDSSIELVVTSPPYPMIEMWDGFFRERSTETARALDDGEAMKAFETMHRELDPVWEELKRVIRPSGIVCVNVGDATRKIDGTFRQFPNHVRIIEAFTDLGFDMLPDILWRKPTNSANKFMGSGMIPPNAYVTLEHEYVLIFRRTGGPRTIDSDRERRYESAYFWEERNRWFSDVWTDVKGSYQELLHPDLRDRAASYPLEIPYRLINMFSLQGDTVLDPFWGTGTTSVAAMIGARNSIGYELNEEFVSVFDEQLPSLMELNRSINQNRISDHRKFVSSSQKQENEFKYVNRPYGLPVKTKQEKELQLREIRNWEKNGNTYTMSHDPWYPEESQSGTETE